MTQVIEYTPRRSLAAAYIPSDEEIKKQQWRKHIAKISKHLATEPIQSEDLTYEQQEWLNFRMARPFPEPYKLRGKIEIPHKWIDDTKT
jgi:hypothetical protein